MGLPEGDPCLLPICSLCCDLSACLQVLSHTSAELVCNAALFNGDTGSVIAVLSEFTLVAQPKEPLDASLGAVSLVPDSNCYKVAIGITGMACCLPGPTESPLEFWKSLCQCTEHITASAPERWKRVCIEVGAPQIILTGAFIDLDQFEHHELAPSAREWDLHVQLLLNVVFKAVADASQSLDGLLGQSVAVFTTVETCDLMVPMHSWMVSRNIAAALRTEGSNTNVQASCASSYVAMHDALKLFRSGQCDTSIVGGSSLLLDPSGSLALVDIEAYSMSGSMRPLDINADGMVCILRTSTH